MKQYTEPYCLAILIANLKQRKKRYPDPITVADCAKFLYDKYDSFEHVAKMVGVDATVIRKWINLANAPEDIRQYVKEGKIYPVAAFNILSKFSDNNKRVEVVKEVIGWGEPEIVRFTKYLKKNPNISVSDGKELFISEVLGELINE